MPYKVGIRRLFKALVRVHQEDPGLTRVLSNEVPYQRARDAYEEEDRQHLMLLEQILQLRPDIKLPNKTAAAHLVVTTTEALTRWIVHEAPVFLDKDFLIEEIVIMLSGYVTRR